MALREFVFKTSAAANLLCAFTREDKERWILIHLFRSEARGPTGRALFIFYAEAKETERFLKGEFAKRYGSYEILHQDGRITSLEVQRYAPPAYGGMDPVQMGIRFLGPDAIFEPILVHEGFIHVKVVAAQRGGRGFRELTSRLSEATSPSDFRLIHQGVWDPVRRLRPQDDRLTPRQTETLRKAVEFGYYDRPRRCTLQDLAKEFQVSKAAVHKHLQNAESILIRTYAP